MTTTTITKTIATMTMLAVTVMIGATATLSAVATTQQAQATVQIPRLHIQAPECSVQPFGEIPAACEIHELECDDPDNPLPIIIGYRKVQTPTAPEGFTLEPIFGCKPLPIGPIDAVPRDE